MFYSNNKRVVVSISTILVLLIIGIGFSYNTYYVQPHKEAAVASTTISYVCASSTTATVVYDDAKGETSHASFSSAVYTTGPLPKVASTTVAVYSNGEFVWWRKGSTGSLNIDNSDGTVLVGDCVESSQ